jgi:hypothetical protein
VSVAVRKMIKNSVSFTVSAELTNDLDDLKVFHLINYLDEESEWALLIYFSRRPVNDKSIFFKLFKHRLFDF